MRLSERYINEPPVISLEVFPPKDAASGSVVETVRELMPLEPAFVSVTCSAGGSGSEETLPVTLELRRALGVETVAHVTCANHSRAWLERHIAQVGASGICNIMALRGDPPRGHKVFIPHPHGHAHACDLVEQIVRINAERPCRAGAGSDQFCIGVAGYPEGHPESPDLATDLKYLKFKVDKGGDFVITQMFFDARYYIDFVGRARRIGIRVPIVPGVMPVERYGQVMRLLEQMGIGIPRRFRGDLLRSREDADAVREICHRHTLELCTRLLEAGAPGLHFYTLNRSGATARILRALRPI